MYRRAEQMGCVTVAQVMEADPPQLATGNEARPLVGEAARLHRIPRRLWSPQKSDRQDECQGAKIPLPAALAKLSALAGRFRINGHCGLCPICFLVTNAGFGLLRALDDRQTFAIPI